MRGALARTSLIASATALVTMLACNDAPTGSLEITTGDEDGAFTRAPAPTTLLVEGVGLDGNTEQLAKVALPTDNVSLGDKNRTDIGAVRVTASDATGKPLLKGETLFVQWGALQDSPLQVFAQRVGELARLPHGPAVLDGPLVGVSVGRFIVAASGSNVFLYDLLRLDVLSGIAPFPRAPHSLVTFGNAAVLIDDQGATTANLTDQTFSDLAAPAGGTFGEVSGGATVYVPDGSAFVVGGTRTTGVPSARVLAITNAGGVAFATLATPRLGACATWVDGRGLVVVGGTTDAKAPGAEVIAPGSVVGTPLAYPADAVKRCGATTLDGSHVLAVGGSGSPADVSGVAPARVFDLTCASNCKPAVWPGSIPLVRAEAFTLAPDAALVAGDDATGATRVFRASVSGPKEVMVKAARRNARLIALPVKGTVALVGGAAPIEQYLE
jgi:hypothetical protein